MLDKQLSVGNHEFVSAGVFFSLECAERREKGSYRFIVFVKENSMIPPGYQKGNKNAKTRNLQEILMAFRTEVLDDHPCTYAVGNRTDE